MELSKPAIKLLVEGNREKLSCLRTHSHGLASETSWGFTGSEKHSTTPRPCTGTERLHSQFLGILGGPFWFLRFVACWVGWF